MTTLAYAQAFDGVPSEESMQSILDLQPWCGSWTIDPWWARIKVDELACLSIPRSFGAVGAFYEDFEQTSDAEVVELLKRASSTRTS